MALLITLLHVACPASALEAVWGQPMREALRSLQQAGLPLVFSNALVTADLRVSGAVDADAPLPAQAAQLLAPAGLGLERSDSGVWYVVRLPAESAANVSAPSEPGAAPAPILEEVVVSSPRYRLVRGNAERQRLDHRQLEVIPSLGRDVLRAVNQLPGQASVGVSARSHLRGGNSNEVLYRVDGVQVIQPFHLSDFHSLFSAVNPALVDSVDVYHAGFPVDYGSRLSGVVDMTLTDPQRPLQGKVMLDFVAVAAHAQGFSGRGEWLVSARRSTLDQVMNALEQDFGRPRFHDELVRLAWQGDTTELVVGALYNNDELDLVDEEAGESASADYHDLTTWVKLAHDFSARSRGEIMVSYAAVDSSRHGTLLDPVDAIGALQESRRFHVTTLRGDFEWRPAPQWGVYAGVEGQRQTADFDVLLESRYGPLGDPLQPAPELERTVAAERDGTLLSGFLGINGGPGAGLTMDVGVRYDLQDNDPVHDAQFSPRLRLAFDNGTNWQAFLDLGRYAQHQNLYELQLDDGLLELSPPQLSDQLSVGVAVQPLQNWQIRAEAYQRRIDDPWPSFENLYNRWVLLPELHADRVPLRADRARTSGLELSVRYQPIEAFQVSLSLAAAQAEEQLDGEWRPRPWEQARTVQAGFDWRPGQWRFGVAVLYHEGWPTTSRLESPAPDASRFYDARLPDYVSVDLHVSRRVEWPRSALEVYFDLSNATLADNVGGYRYELDDGVWAREPRNLLPGVPVLGLSWTW